MSVSHESRRLLWVSVGVALVGALVLLPLAWLATRMYQEAGQRRVAAANEAAAIAALESISAAEHLYFQSKGEYGTFPQLVESGFFQAPLTGEGLVASGYAFTLRVTPRSAERAPFYSVNADPLKSGGRDATGRRHFYIDSDITGMRYNEERPAGPSDKARQTVQQP